MKQAINFDWQFVGDYKDEYLNKLPNSSVRINIPHCAKEVPYNYFNEKDYQFISTYEKVYDIEENIDITEEKNTDSLSPESTKNKKSGLRKDNRGIGVVEIVLILVVLIALIIIFKDKIIEIINAAFESISDGASSL